MTDKPTRRCKANESKQERVQSKPTKTGSSSKFLRVFVSFLALSIGILWDLLPGL